MTQQGCAFWLTGLPGSGKSTLALAVKEAFPDVVVLSMDELRKVVTPEPTYSDEERECLYMALAYTAWMLTAEGLDVVIDATANRRRWRDAARVLIPDFHEVYVKCPLDVSRGREAGRVETHGAPSGIYEKAGAGAPVPGVNVPYEEPERPELVVDTGVLTPDEAGARLVGYVGMGRMRGK
ncbi:MAG: adenylyl-sulfate kinase [Nitrospirae bacterium]|nr:adenylyl-sulfate kinase [Nitrospirota bacterium]